MAAAEQIDDPSGKLVLAGALPKGRAHLVEAEPAVEEWRGTTRAGRPTGVAAPAMPTRPAELTVPEGPAVADPSGVPTSTPDGTGRYAKDGSGGDIPDRHGDTPGGRVPLE